LPVLVCSGSPSPGDGRFRGPGIYQEVYEDGELDTKREFKEVKINAGLADGLFERPGAGPGQEPPKEPPQPSYPGQVKACHILVGSSAEAEAVRKAVHEKGGTLDTFMDAARRHSKDVTTKRAGGALGWFTKVKMVREFSKEAFALKPGEISKSIKTTYGWHLIFLKANGDQPRPAKRF
jgi:parvulin-like peptidyl-prolyl isomerase